MNQSIRSKIVIPIVILLAVTALVLAVSLAGRSPRSSLPVRRIPPALWSPERSGRPRRGWRRGSDRRPPTPKEFAIAYAPAIWTYDTTRHSFYDWEDAVSVYADPTGAAPRVAKSLLPRWSEWKQLELSMFEVDCTVACTRVHRRLDDESAVVVAAVESTPLPRTGVLGNGL